MTETTTEPLTPELIARVRKLSPADKDRLYEQAFDSDDHRRIWREEITDRIGAVRRGEMKSYSLDETMAYLQAVVDEGAGS